MRGGSLRLRGLFTKSAFSKSAQNLQLAKGVKSPKENIIKVHVIKSTE